MNGLRGKSCDQAMKVPASCQFTVFPPQAPRKIGEVNPKLLGRLSQPGKEHIEASSCRHHIILECECPEQLPRLLDQYVDFRYFHRRKLSWSRQPCIESEPRTTARPNLDYLKFKRLVDWMLFDPFEF